MRRTLPAALAALTVLAAGCGDDDTDEPTAAAPAPAPTASAESTTAAETEATTKPAAAAERAQEPAPRRASGSNPEVETVATGLRVPWDVAFLPDGRALVTERGGAVRFVSAGGKLQRSPAGRVATQASGEGGLLGIAIDPEFADGRRFAYVYVTRSSGMEVRRLRVSGNRVRDDGRVLRGIKAGSIHDSGRLRFGPDKRLYVATGDAGERQLAQRRSSLNGKFLRLSEKQYRSRTAKPEIYSIGHRNPQGLDWQPGSKRLFATEHGPSGFDGGSGNDEVNLVRRGKNYGWPNAIGRDHSGFTAPAQLYVDTIAPSGAAFVTKGGSSWSGNFVLAALAGEQLRRLTISPGGRVTADRPELDGRYGRLRGVTEAPDGTLWVTTSNRDGRGSPQEGDDKILRVIPPRG